MGKETFLNVRKLQIRNLLGLLRYQNPQLAYSPQIENPRFLWLIRKSQISNQNTAQPCH